MGLQGRLIGYHARRIHNVLVITGDPPKMSPTYPRSTAVFDLDSASVVRHVHAHLNAGMDFGSQPLGRQADPRTHFTIGSGFEPEAVNMERELEKLRRKLDAGVDYIFTQPVFRRGPLDAIRPHVGQVRVFAGVMVLSSLEHARRVAQVPGVVIPDTVLSKLSRSERPEDQLKAGIELAASQVRQARSDGWAGVYLMSPSGHEHVIEILRAGLT
jgi:homocysteine S-methyltransferase